MDFAIIAMGKAGSGAISEQVDTYLSRMPWPCRVIELEDRRASRDGTSKAREADLILKTLPQSAEIVALDEHGKQFTSRKFAKKIAQFQQDGKKQLVFILGGADGLDARVLEKATFKLSLGEMTWPHMLARVMLAEQLYRASTILSGHPYHRD